MLPFLQFALEIRLEVYENLPTKTPRVSDTICLDHLEYSFPHSILCTNKQIRSEAEPILYRNNSYNHYLEQDFQRKTYILRHAQARLSTTICMCPFLRSINLHIVFPSDFENTHLSGQETTTLTRRMQWTCEFLEVASSVKEVRVSARKQVPTTQILPGNAVGLIVGLLNLSQKYRRVLTPLKSLPATLTITYGGTPLCLDDDSSLTERYWGLCEEMFCQTLDNTLAERLVSVGSAASHGHEVSQLARDISNTEDVGSWW